MRNHILCWVCLAFALIGCNPRDIAGPGEIEGEYAFHFKTGEVQVTVMHKDMTYRQEFYRTLVDYQKHYKPAYTNAGTWSYEGRKIIWNSPLVFCHLHDPSRLLAIPERYAEEYGFWMPQSRERDALILIDSDYDYSYRRVKSRNGAN